jgi:hypothetical protein
MLSASTEKVTEAREMSRLDKTIKSSSKIDIEYIIFVRICRASDGSVSVEVLQPVSSRKEKKWRKKAIFLGDDCYMMQR